jgi:hypothetical protein
MNLFWVNLIHACFWFFSPILTSFPGICWTILLIWVPGTILLFWWHTLGWIRMTAWAHGDTTVTVWWWFLCKIIAELSPGIQNEQINPLSLEDFDMKDINLEGIDTSALINATDVSSNPVHGEVYSMQHYLSVTCDRSVVFFRVLRFPPPLKLTATI